MKKLIFAALMLTFTIVALTGCTNTATSEETNSIVPEQTVVEETVEETEEESTENAVVEEKKEDTVIIEPEHTEEPQAEYTEIPVTAIDVKDMTVEEGSLTATDYVIIPADANTGTELRFVSSYESVAKVDTIGFVTAVAPGTATITVTSENGITATYTVTVPAKEYIYTESNVGGALGSGAVKEEDDPSYYPEGSILYGMTYKDILAAYPEPAYGTVSFENENAKAPWYWQHVTVTYTWEGDTCYQNLIFGGVSNQEEVMKYVDQVYPWPENGEEKSAVLWVYLGDGLM